MTRVALLALAALAASLPARAAPPAPAMFRAVPRYTAPPLMVVSFTEVAGAARYDVTRKVDGGTLSVLATIAPTTAGTRHDYFDTGVGPDHDYTYTVRACDAASACTATPEITSSPRIAWPVDDSHEILHGFNEVIGYAGVSGTTGAGVGYHDGVDIQKTTSDPDPGNDILAPRGGVVDQLNLNLAKNDNGVIVVRVDVGSAYEFDSFNHIANGDGNVPPVAIGDVVSPGQKIARIGTRFFDGDFDDHTHAMTIGGAPFGNSLRHFLLNFGNPADRDPMGNAPSLFDENDDGKVVLFRDHGSGALLDYTPPAQPVIGGDVDVEPEVTDEQGDDPRQAPIDLGYWIHGPLPASDALDDVKSAGNPYELYDFRFVYFGGGVPTPCNLVSDVDDLANAGCKGMTPAGCIADPMAACNSVITENGSGIPFPWPVLHHFIVTHAKGEMGIRADVDPNQYWRTKAKDDRGPVTGANANYAGMPLAAKASEARFPDGDYTIHVIASDLVHPKVDLPLPVVRVENYPPFIEDMGVTMGPSSVSCPTPLYDYHYPGIPKPYAAPADLVAARRDTFAAAGSTVCVHVRFSEPIDPAKTTVKLYANRGTGSLIGTFTGGPSKTRADNDTWIGTLFLPEDQTGNSDSVVGSTEHDAAVEVTAFDRPDANGDQRGLDANDDGAQDGVDRNHVVKIDLSTPKATVDVLKTP